MRKRTIALVCLGTAAVAAAPGFVRGVGQYGLPLPDLGAAYADGQQCGDKVASQGMGPYTYGGTNVDVVDITSEYDLARCIDRYEGMTDPATAFDLSVRTARGSVIDMPGAVAYGVWNSSLAGLEDLSVHMGYDAAKARVRDRLMAMRPEDVAVIEAAREAAARSADQPAND